MLFLICQDCITNYVCWKQIHSKAACERNKNDEIRITIYILATLTEQHKFVDLLYLLGNKLLSEIVNMILTR
jgi:hypothetical protein